jgi:hypothetical protein
VAAGSSEQINIDVYECGYANLPIGLAFPFLSIEVGKRPKMHDLLFGLELDPSLLDIGKTLRVQYGLCPLRILEHAPLTLAKFRTCFAAPGLTCLLCAGSANIIKYSINAEWNLSYLALVVQYFLRPMGIDGVFCYQQLKSY